MGNCWGSKEVVVVASKASLLQFDELGLSKKDVEKLYIAFDEMDKDCGGYISSAEFFSYLSLPVTTFGSRVFKMMNQGGGEKIRFPEFVNAVWHYCTIDDEALCRFAFELYQVTGSGDGFLGADEINFLLNELYGGAEKLEQNKSAKKSKSDMLELARSTEDGFIDYEQFVDFSKKHQSLLFPAFSMQHQIQEKILGASFWEKQGKRRRKQEARKAKEAADGASAVDEENGQHEEDGVKEEKEGDAKKEHGEAQAQAQAPAQPQANERNGHGWKIKQPSKPPAELGKVALKIGRTDFEPDDFKPSSREEEPSIYDDKRQKKTKTQGARTHQATTASSATSASASAVPAEIEAEERRAATQDRIRERSLMRKTMLGGGGSLATRPKKEGRVGGGAADTASSTGSQQDMATDQSDSGREGRWRLRASNAHPGHRGGWGGGPRSAISDGDVLHSRATKIGARRSAAGAGGVRGTTVSSQNVLVGGGREGAEGRNPTVNTRVRRASATRLAETEEGDDGSVAGGGLGVLRVRRRVSAGSPASAPRPGSRIGSDLVDGYDGDESSKQVVGGSVDVAGSTNELDSIVGSVASTGDVAGDDFSFGEASVKSSCVTTTGARGGGGGGGGRRRPHAISPNRRSHTTGGGHNGGVDVRSRRNPTTALTSGSAVNRYRA